MQNQTEIKKRRGRPLGSPNKATIEKQLSKKAIEFIENSLEDESIPSDLRLQAAMKLLEEKRP